MSQAASRKTKQLIAAFLHAKEMGREAFFANVSEEWYMEVEILSVWPQ